MQSCWKVIKCVEQGLILCLQLEILYADLLLVLLDLIQEEPRHLQKVIT